ncbi:MAG: hypothetical protein M1837_005416 [Sclerophora amabilis]|nr:MAG: hypothetical protein M1837_005416 [Sclerophora amabilis]
MQDVEFMDRALTPGVPSPSPPPLEAPKQPTQNKKASSCRVAKGVVRKREKNDTGAKT